VDAGDLLTVETREPSGVGCPTPIDTVVEVFASDGTPLGQNDEGGINSCSLLTIAAATTDTYVACVTDFLDNDSYAYSLSMTITDVVCGDGVLAPNEQCDDGNTNAGDGCSDVCAIETCGPGEAAVIASSAAPTTIVDVSTVTSTLTMAAGAVPS